MPARKINPNELSADSLWRDEVFLMIWDSDKKQFRLAVDQMPVDPTPSVENILNINGHLSFSPQGFWVVTDEPRRVERNRLALVVYNAGGWTWSDPLRHWTKEYTLQCDAQTRWSRDGSQICIESVHEGTRQLKMDELFLHC